VPLPEVVRMASLTPARIAGVDAALGSLAAGKYADLVVLDRELMVRQVYIGGERVAETIAVQPFAFRSVHSVLDCRSHFAPNRERGHGSGEGRIRIGSAGNLAALRPGNGRRTAGAGHRVRLRPRVRRVLPGSHAGGIG